MARICPTYLHAHVKNWPNLPLLGANLDMDLINLFSVNYVPMEVATDEKLITCWLSKKYPIEIIRGAGGKTGQRQIWTRWGKYSTRNISEKLLENLQ